MAKKKTTTEQPDLPETAQVANEPDAPDCAKTASDEKADAPAEYPNAGSEWAWHWLWPSREPGFDPVAKVRRRWHVHETAFQKAAITQGIC